VKANQGQGQGGGGHIRDLDLVTRSVPGAEPPQRDKRNWVSRRTASVTTLEEVLIRVGWGGAAHRASITEFENLTLLISQPASVARIGSSRSSAEEKEKETDFLSRVSSQDAVPCHDQPHPSPGLFSIPSPLPFSSPFGKERREICGAACRLVWLRNLSS
jgi:hypothetical protein